MTPKQAHITEEEIAQLRLILAGGIDKDFDGEMWRAVPRLLAEVERLRAERDAARNVARTSELLLTGARDQEREENIVEIVKAQSAHILQSKYISLKYLDGWSSALEYIQHKIAEKRGK